MGVRVSGYLVLVSSIVISLAGFAVTVIAQTRSLVRTASTDYVHRLEKRVDECERDRAEQKEELEDVKQEVRRLMAREVELMRMLTEKGVV